MKNKLTISESFLSLQGEGHTTGIPAIFLRLAGCNLLCKSDSWICDSIEVWQKGTATPFEEILNDDYIQRLFVGDCHLIFTGGEPLLHQTKIVEYLNWFNEKYDFLPVIEVETNGTIVPNEGMLQMVDYWNCSPKLSTSGETHKKRVNELALNVIGKQPKAMFKFVVSTEEEIMEIMNEYNIIDMNQITLMPCGDSRELLDKVRLTVVELCIKYSLKYSDRLHIVIWNKKTGV